MKEESFALTVDLLKDFISMSAYIKYFGPFTSDSDVIERLYADDENTRIAAAHVATSALKLLQSLVSKLPKEMVERIHTQLETNNVKNMLDLEFLSRAEAKKKEFMAKIKPNLDKLKHDPKNPKTIDGKLKAKLSKKLKSYVPDLPECANVHLN
jgi:hypothetical protein